MLRVFFVCTSSRIDANIRFGEKNSITPEMGVLLYMLLYADAINWERNENFPAQLYSKGASHTRRERSSQVGWKPKRIEISIFPSIYIYIYCLLSLWKTTIVAKIRWQIQNVYFGEIPIWGGGGKRAWWIFSFAKLVSYIWLQRSARTDSVLLVHQMRFEPNICWENVASIVCVCVIRGGKGFVEAQIAIRGGLYSVRRCSQGDLLMMCGWMLGEWIFDTLPLIDGWWVLGRFLYVYLSEWQWLMQLMGSLNRWVEMWV